MFRLGVVDGFVVSVWQRVSHVRDSSSIQEKPHVRGKQIGQETKETDKAGLWRHHD